MISVIRAITANLNDKDKNTVIFAAKELQKYLSLVSDEVYTVVPSQVYQKDEKGILYVGINLLSEIPEVADVELDDAIFIDADKSGGTITASNARSVLIGVYRYLKELGFVFLRPGKDGERYPSDFSFKKIYVCEKASYRHRAVCMEGSVYQQNLIDVIDWVPKASMNGYFIQFQLPRAFFERWYEENTPYRDKVNITDDDIRAVVSLAEGEIAKRSLMYHAVGHGWTSQAVGIDGSSWAVSDEPDSEYTHLLALVNGERKLSGKIALNTNLCYSNPEAVSRVTDGIVDYCRSHPDVTYLHFWLADGSNNNCECENCIKKRTSDYYIQMLNELDRKLTKEGIQTRIVFLIYVDLLWKPLYEKFADSSRFVMMFAPITRSYTTSFNPDSEVPVRPYELNKLVFPVNADENIAYLKEWEKDFNCDSFDFDYHYMWDHYYDFSRYNLDKVLYNDIKSFDSLGLNGLVSCQTQRTSFPTSVGINIMAETLWNKEICFDDVADRILSAEFGERFMLVKDYLSHLSDLGCSEAIRTEIPITEPECACKLQSALDLIADFEPVLSESIAEHYNTEYKTAWQKLSYHSELYKMILKFYLDISVNKKVGDYSHIKDFVLRNELAYKEDFDAWCFIETFEVHVISRLKKMVEK